MFHKRITVADLSKIKPVTRLGERKVDSVALLNQLNEGEHGINIPIGNIHRSSYKSVFSSVTYELSMTLMTSCGTSNSTIRAPITLHRGGTNFAGRVPEVGKSFSMPTGWDGIVMPTAELILEEPVAAYDTVRGLAVLVKASKTISFCSRGQWVYIEVLRDWLEHAPHNVSLLTPDTIFELLQYIKEKPDSYIYKFCEDLGEAMASSNSNNRCTCSHISEATRAVPSRMKLEMCILFARYCTDRHNALHTFSDFGFTDIEMLKVMRNYK